MSYYSNTVPTMRKKIRTATTDCSRVRSSRVAVVQYFIGLHPGHGIQNTGAQYESIPHN